MIESLRWVTNWDLNDHKRFSVTSAFDLAEEKFSEVPKPDLVDDDYVIGLGVVV